MFPIGSEKINIFNGTEREVPSNPIPLKKKRTLKEKRTG
jgi:hypothetical protein